MIEELDRSLFLIINSINSPFFDEVMHYITRKYTWVPLYAFVLFIYFRERGREALLLTIFAIILITASDQGSVRLFKDQFMRLRPCHDPDIAHLVHIVRDRCGGLYGFISSHASNTFAFALFSHLVVRRRWFAVTLFSWATLVSYSRLYVGVHYPGDIVVGALFGMLTALLIYYLYRILYCRCFKRIPLFTKPEAKPE